MEDDDLSHLLDKAADPPVATPDSFREVMARYQRGRTRSLLAALVAVALLGPAVGVAVGRSTSKKSVQVATGDSTQTAPTAPSATSSESWVADGSVGSSVSGIIGSGFMGNQSPARRLFIRTTADGVTVRAYLQENIPKPFAGDARCATEKGEVPCPEPSLPPPECFPDSQLQAELSNEGAVDPGFVPWNAVDEAAPLVVLHSSYFGVVEGDPAAWVAVKGGEGVASVRVRFADGATDEMETVEGFAVLAHATAAPELPSDTPPDSPEEAEEWKKAWLPQGTVEALDAGGSVVATSDSLAPTENGALSEKCMPKGMPVPMPEPVPGSTDPGAPGAVEPDLPVTIEPAVPATAPERAVPGTATP